jgi:excisionase family DNA binding protein
MLTRKKRASQSQSRSTSDVVDAQGAADFLNAHVETLRRLARRGEIPSFKVGKDWRFSKKALQQWVEQQQSRTRLPTVLMIDDDILLLEVMGKSLKEAGCLVRTATSGGEGLRMVAEETPDLVLLDLVMPGMSGPEFLRKLRIDHPGLPVVIVTGYPDSDLIKEAMEHGPLLLLAKPVEPAQLKMVVTLVVGKGLAQST